MVRDVQDADAALRRRTLGVCHLRHDQGERPQHLER